LIGVDIVDFADPLLKKRTARALLLISHPLDSCPFDLSENELFWLYWTAKEAAFKAHRWQVPFSPKEIGVNYFKYENDSFHFRAAWKKELVGIASLTTSHLMAVCSTGSIQSIITKKYSLEEVDQSMAIGPLIEEDLPEGFELYNDTRGLPEAKCDSVIFPVSISHHHHLGAAAWLPLEM